MGEPWCVALHLEGPTPAAGEEQGLVSMTRPGIVWSRKFLMIFENLFWSPKKIRNVFVTSQVISLNMDFRF